MSPHVKQFLADVGAIGIVVGFIIVLTHQQWFGFNQPINTRATTVESGTSDMPRDVTQSASVNSSVSTSTPRKSPPKPPIKSAPIARVEQTATPPATSLTAATSSTFSVARIEDPYPFPPQTFDVINNQTRPALVNILCGARAGTFRPISASGVIIDPRGVILTNAHVAQYFLLSSDPTVDLSCVIRSGSPAYPTWNAEVLFIPPSWVNAHASDIKQARPIGTGEYDYALLRITQGLNDQPLPVEFPFVPIDARETIGFTDDAVLVASYPAEFVGGIVAQLNLYPVSSITTIKKMLTFDNKTVDAISVGGVIEAQGGSSGGAVVNAWGRLVGIISTTSEGTTTAERDLHAITLSYINRNISSESGFDLESLITGNLSAEVNAFNANEAPALRQLLIDQIKPH